MKNDEPETRHLCVAELREYLAKTRLQDVAGVPVTAPRMSVNPLEIGRPVRGNVASASGATPAASDPREASELAPAVTGTSERASRGASDDARTWVFQRRDLTPPKRGRLRHWGVRVVPAALACCCLLAYLLHANSIASKRSAASPPSPATPRAQSSAARAGGRHAPVVANARGEGTRASPIKVREAVDLLFSGDSRAALDAYRQLHSQVPESTEFALAVRLLEREVARCADPSASPGAPCAH